MILEILICTYNQGIQRVPRMLLEPVQNVKWLVSFQYSDVSIVVPQVLQERTDVTVVSIEGKGLSSNRNNAFQHATGDILLIADDDCLYSPSSLQHIIKTFTSHPEVDIACFQALTDKGNLLRKYPTCEFDYAHTPKGYWFTSFEIACRRTSFLPSFDERFGINGTLFGCGEEEVFLHQSFVQGLYICYFPIPIVSTNPQTTAHAFYQDVHLQRAKGAVLYIMHGKLGAFLRCFKFACCNASKTKRPVSLFWQMCKGIKLVTK